ncbi:hypothetical protein ACIQXD_04880 [Streptomyces uncialis]|uniref:hypothetical protein n=1 Tax=Streptomyces uncialis TaxID=1048205 RepID=UPI0037FACD6B
MSAARRVSAAAGVIRAAWENGVTGDPQSTAAQALEDAGMLMSPEIAAGLAAGPAAPQTERSYFVAIADALNAVPNDQPLGIDLDGTITDHENWSVVWNAEASRWEVAGYDDEKPIASASEPRPQDSRACGACGDVPELWCPDCAACRTGCFDGRRNNTCSHVNASWGGAS